MIQFITPNRIYVRSLPHLFSNLSNTCRSNQSGQVLSQQNPIYVVTSYYLCIQSSYYPSFTPSFWRKKLHYCPWGDIVSSSNLSRKNLPSQSVTKVFAYSSYQGNGLCTPTHLPWIYTFVTKFYNINRWSDIVKQTNPSRLNRFKSNNLCFFFPDFPPSDQPNLFHSIILAGIKLLHVAVIFVEFISSKPKWTQLAQNILTDLFNKKHVAWC
jgi:hypothetical protein